MRRTTLLSIAVAVLLAAPAAAQGPPGREFLISKSPTRFDVSRPLREIVPVPPGLGPRRLVPEFEPPKGTYNRPIEVPVHLPQGPHLVQTWQGEVLMPAATTNFEGVGAGTSGYTVQVAPPDTQGDVGPDDYVQWVNVDFAVFDKVSGTITYGPAAGNTLWSGFGGLCESRNDGDPIVKYDRLADRWVMTQFAINEANDQYAQCIAVSQTGDPTGSWFRYSYYFSTLNDYPKLAVWPDGYYISYNMFQKFGASYFYAGAVMCAYDRAAMLTGDPSPLSLCTSPSSYYFSYLPSDLDGSTTPPEGADNYVMALGTTNQLLFWTTHIDWDTPGNSVFTGPTAFTVASFTEECEAYPRGACIPQEGTTVKLESLGDRPMFRLPYRNFGDHESLVLSHSVDTGSEISGIRWYEIRDPGGTPYVYQSGTYAPDSHYRWMGSMAMDRVGNMAVGYSVSDSNMNPSIWYTGRLVSDPLNELGQTEAVIQNGTGSQTTWSQGDLQRWGDYSTMSIDPVDDCTFWYTQEYLTDYGSFNWHTRIASFEYPSCSCTASAPTELTAVAIDDISIQLDWSPATGADEYHVYRSTTSRSGYALIATAVSAPPYLDTDVQEGLTYYYVVASYNADQDCESAYSSEASATARPCDLAPTFAGLSSAASNGHCAIDLSWDAATAICGGPVDYAVYRSTSTGFTPSLANRIAAGVSGTSYTDGSGVTSDTVYAYIVRAADRSNGQEDSNTVEQYARPTPPDIVDGTWFAGAEPGDPSMYTNGSWTISPNRFSSGSRSYHSGYSNNLCAYLRTPAVELTAGQSSILSFQTAWDIENKNDGGVVEISTDGGISWLKPILSPGYPGSFSDDSNACGYPQNEPAYTAPNKFTFKTYTVDLAAYHGQEIMIRWNFSTDEAGTREGWYVDGIAITHARVPGACDATPSDVPYLTARSTSNQVKLEWVNPSVNYHATRICRDTTGYPTDPAACPALHHAPGSGAGAYDTYTDETVIDGNTYYYTAWVDNGSGLYSGGVNAWARPFDTSGKVKWSYSSAASSLAPPGVLPGAIGAGGAWAVSNDRLLHGMNPTADGGDWPRTSPFSWVPMAMNAPAQACPPIVPTTAVPGASNVIFLGSEDGYVYAVDAQNGETLWQSSEKLGSILFASVSGMFTRFPGGNMDVLFIGTRNTTADNVMYALDPADGSVMYEFDNGGGADGIGIISSGAAVDYDNNRIYFASRARAGGSQDTLWCLSFDENGFTKEWSAPFGDIDGAPTPHEGRLYIGTNSGVVYAVDPSDGDHTVFWSYYGASGYGPVKGFITPEDATTFPRRIFFSTTDKVWSIIDHGDYASADWESTVDGASVPLAPFGAGVLYVGSSDGRLHQLDASTGVEQADVQLGDGLATVGSPTRDYINDMAYVGSESGAVYCVELPLVE